MLGPRAFRLFPLLIPALVSLLSVTTIGLTQNSANDYDVRISLYRPLDEVELNTSLPAWRFTTITVPAGIRSIRELLLSSHLFQDSDAMALMYALNPDLRDPLQASANVRIIQIPVTPEITKALSDGFLFKIYYDDRIMKELISSRERLRALSDGISALAPERYADPSLRQTAVNCMSSVSRDFDQIANHLEDRDQPTNHEMLLQVRDEVELVLRTLSWMTTGNGTLAAPDRDTICAVANDLQIKQRGFDNTRRDTSAFLKWPEAHVIVNTFDSVTQKPVSKLTIHYAPEALQHDPTWTKQFPALTSPTESMLPEADYVFWATEDGVASPVSDRKPVSVRIMEDLKPLVVEIVVRP